MSNQAAVDAVLDALGDRTRRQIVERLRGGPMPVGKLADRLTVGRPAVSKHLRVLEGAGLVEHRRAGTRNLYALAPAGYTALQQWLVATWDRTLAAAAGYATLAQDDDQSVVRGLLQVRDQPWHVSMTGGTTVS